MLDDIKEEYLFPDFLIQLFFLLYYSKKINWIVIII